MWLLLPLSTFVIVVIAIRGGQASTRISCYSNDTQRYKFYSTKTAGSVIANNDDAAVEMEEGCVATKFWLIVRHGTRHPGDDDIIEMAEKAPEIRDRVLEAHKANEGQLCVQDLLLLRHWSFRLKPDEEKLLTQSGRDELKTMGTRFRRRFPGLLDKDFESNLFKFRHTKKERTESSAVWYGHGAFPDEDVEMATPIEDDPLLEFYEHCSKWAREVDDADETYWERYLFMISSFMTEVIVSVSQRLGVELSLDEVKMIYDLCRYEQAFQPQEPSAWCAAFNTDNLKVLEYYEDLKYFYTGGYGSKINTEMACPLIKDMSDSFNETNTPRGTFYFSHSPALLSLASLLGIAKNDDDTTLRSDNFVEMSDDRKYRPSKIGAFASNIGFVLLDCGNEGKKIMAMHQERPVVMEGCSDVACDWDEFQREYKDMVNCQFDLICENGSGRHYVATGGKGLILQAIILVVISFFPALHM